MIHLDFETRSECQIYDSGAWVYSAHPSTEILCLAYAIDNGPVEIFTHHELYFDARPLALYEAVEKGHLISAFNAFFEQSIWANIMIKKYNAPRIPIKRWRCVQAKASARSLPRSLGECSKALNCSVQKDEAGRRIMLKLCKPKPDGSWHEDPDDLQKLYEYCINDVETEREIDNRLPDLIQSEQQIWFLDQLINQRGIYVDKTAINRALEIIDVHTESLNGLVADVSEGKLEGVSRRMAVLQWCQAQGVDIKGYSKRDVASVLQEDVPAAVRTVLETKLSLGRTSVKKFRAMDQSADGIDGRIRDLLLYHGANTGRWAGKLIQIHNLPKGNIKNTDEAIDIMMQSDYETFKIFYPDVMATLSSCIRGMIIAAPGKDLIVADYNAIEARVVMWLSGEEFGLKQFKEGKDLYVDMARTIYGRTGANISAMERQLGKAAVLGCGFGMGPTKFLATCVSWGIPVTSLLAEKAVGSYRTLFKKVQNSWFLQEAAAIKAVQTSERILCGKVSWIVDGDVLLCRLPSGRCLSYNNPTLEYVDTPWGERKLALHFMGLIKAAGQTTTKWGRQHTYGGKLVENITQAVARDILAAAMFNCESKGYKVGFSVHDEIVCEVPTEYGSVSEFESILCTLPVWAQGCPITAKAWRGKRYRKD